MQRNCQIEDEFVDKLDREGIELRKGVLCAVVGGCLREGGLAKVGCGNNRHGEVCKKERETAEVGGTEKEIEKASKAKTASNSE